MDLSPAFQVIRASIEKGWVQHVEALSIIGLPVRGSDDYAKRWSLLGATCAADVLHHAEACAARLVLARLCDPAHCGEPGWNWERALKLWNDEPGRTREEVLALIDRAAEEMKAREVA